MTVTDELHQRIARARTGGASSKATVELVEALHNRVAALEASLLEAERRHAWRARLYVLLAHEVRTPLTVVLGTLETLRAGPLDEDVTHELIESAARNARVLSEVVQDLLAGDGENPPAVLPRAQLKLVRLENVVQEAIGTVAETLDRRRVTCEGTDCSIMTSPGRLRAILTNFFENAARYGGHAPIECWASSHAGTVRIGVSDRGRGLGGCDPEELFEPFVQGVGAHPDGRGMGLYLVRMLARSLGGTAGLTERANGGTTAWVELPRHRIDDEVAASRTPDRGPDAGER